MITLYDYPAINTLVVGIVHILNLRIAFTIVLGVQMNKPNYFKQLRN